jgi:hypothetical protein
MASPNHDLPRYRILNYPGFFAENDTLYPPDTEIVYTGVPNEQMLPLNDAAKKAMDAYLDGLEQHHRKSMADRGLSPDIRRPRDLSDALEVEAAAQKKARVYAAAEGEVPQMPNLARGAQKAGADKIVEAKPMKIERTKPVPILGAMNQSDAS